MRTQVVLMMKIVPVTFIIKNKQPKKIMKHNMLLASCMIIALQALTQPGTLDSSFANEGTLIEKKSQGIGLAVALQQDGKIIISGEGVVIPNSGSFLPFLLYRYNNDGSADSGFGINGMVETRFSVAATVQSLAVQADGKILATGQLGSDIGVVRYKQNGLLDSSFGTNGVSIVDLGAGEYSRALALQSDGKIVVTGLISSNSSDNQRAFIARFLSNGSLDDSFGKSGTTITEFKSETNLFNIAIQADGKILAGGGYDYYGRPRYIVVRYNTNGSADSTFGINGIAISNSGRSDGDGTMYAIAFQHDGKIIGAGSGNNPNASTAGDMQIMRFNNNGTIDPSFGIGGRAFAVFGSQSIAKSVVVQNDDKIIIGGYTTYNLGSGNDIALARFTVDGILDLPFGVNGLQTTSLTNSSVALAIAIQGDGKIVAAGEAYVNNPPGSHLSLVRYKGDPINISITKK